MNDYLKRSTHAAPLAVFRIAFGLLIFASMIRFWMKGWIHDLYVAPEVFFPFYGFEFVQPLGEYTYIIFFLCAISALMVAAGFFYRFASIILFVTFTYIELIDKSTYLNHYYFISLICLLMIFLPAHAYFSVDAYRNKDLNSDRIPKWSLDTLILFVCLVYFYAGIAKINSDWLFKALPLRIWLPAKNDIPVLGQLFNQAWVPFAFSWLGCIYDVCIPFLLLNKSTRVFAYLTVVIFHGLTALLFPIGMFPYIMMATALIFFSAEFHQKIIATIASWIRATNEFVNPQKTFQYKKTTSRIITTFIAVFFLVQASLPFRYLLYPGELFWTEEGYRFSWRVMLMEKAGNAQFTVKDKTGKILAVDNSEFLTTLQEKMVSTQPDMILQFAHKLRDHYTKQGLQEVEVYVDSYVTLNGRLGRPLVDPDTDLAKQIDSFNHKSWILDFNDEIKGL